MEGGRGGGGGQGEREREARGAREVRGESVGESVGGARLWDAEALSSRCTKERAKRVEESGGVGGPTLRRDEGALYNAA